MFRLRRSKLTRIICTLDEDALMYEDETLAKMMEEGMDMVRIQITNTCFKTYSALINKLYNVAADTGAIIGVILDISSPHRFVKIPTSSCVKVSNGQVISVGYNDAEDYEERCEEGTGMRLTKLGSAKVGQSIMFGEEVTGEIQEIKEESVSVLIQNEGVITNNQRVYIDGNCSISKNLSEKQVMAIDFAVEAGADFISFPFSVENFDTELDLIKEKISIGKKKIKIIARLTSEMDKQKLTHIVVNTDGIIIARGPMGAEMPIERICTYQKQVVATCGEHAKPVLVSGHVLGSLRTLPYPLRADASDVYNGVLDGIDGFILAPEIIHEDTWMNTFQMLIDILELAESELNPRQTFQKIWMASHTPSVQEAVASSSVKTCIELNASFIVCFTARSKIPCLVAKYRSPVPIITVSNLLRTLQQLIIHRGIVPMLGDVTDHKKVLRTSIEQLKPFCSPGSIVILVSEWQESHRFANEQMGVLTIN